MSALPTIAVTVSLLSVTGCGLRAPLPTPLGTHVAPPAEGLQLVWSTRGVFIPSDGAHLRINATTVFLAGGINGDLRVNLVALDQTTGTLLWQRDVAPTALEVEDAAVYAGSIDAISAYDTQGKVIWSTPLPLTRTVISISLDKDQLNVLTASTELIQIERATGVMLNREPAPGLLARAHGVRYYLPGSIAGLQARTEESGILWQTELGANASTIAGAIPGTLIVKTGGPAPHAFGLDERTGAIKWGSEQALLSNVASGGEFAAYLDTDGHLHIVDANNGESVASAAFAPGDFPRVDSDLHPRSYEVAVSLDGAVVVYFGDSMELFAFRIAASSDAA